jgi:hypothetical protein
VCENKDCIGFGNGLCDAHDASHHASPPFATHSRWPRLPASLLAPSSNEPKLSVCNLFLNLIHFHCLTWYGMVWYDRVPWPIVSWIYQQVLVVA